MKYKKDASKVHSDDVLYDLFYGGYIKPEEFLEKESAEDVEAAIEVILEFIEGLEERGLIEEM